jgi:hypothetical protein
MMNAQLLNNQVRNKLSFTSFLIDSEQLNEALAVINSAAAAELRRARAHRERERPLFSDYARDRRASTIKGNSHRQTIKRRHRSRSIKKKRGRTVWCNKQIGFVGRFQMQQIKAAPHNEIAAEMTHLKTRVIAAMLAPESAYIMHECGTCISHRVVYMQFSSLCHIIIRVLMTGITI